MATEARLPLARERILQTALELADRSDVDGLTMRRLGDELGFEAMSLYRHVANKQDLLDGMLDLVLIEWEMPADSADWAESIRASAQSVHEALRRHRWAAQLLMTGSHMRPRRLVYMEWVLGTLRGAGFDADTTYHVYHLLDGHIFGFTLWEIAYTKTGEAADENAAQLMQTIPWHDHPYLTEHRDQHLNDGPHRDTSAFDTGLDLILDGLQKTLRSPDSF